MLYYYDPQPPVLFESEAGDGLGEWLNEHLPRICIACDRYVIESIRARIRLPETIAATQSMCVEEVVQRVRSDLSWGREQQWQTACRVFQPNDYVLVVGSCFRPDRLSPGSFILEQRILRRKCQLFRIWRAKDE